MDSNSRQNLKEYCEEESPHVSSMTVLDLISDMEAAERQIEIQGNCRRAEQTALRAAEAQVKRLREALNSCAINQVAFYVQAKPVLASSVAQWVYVHGMERIAKQALTDTADEGEEAGG